IQTCALPILNALAGSLFSSKRATECNALAGEAAEIWLARMNALVFGSHPIHLALASTHIGCWNILIWSKYVSKVLYIFFADHIQLTFRVLSWVYTYSAFPATKRNIMQCVF